MRPSVRPRRPTCESGDCMQEYRRRTSAVPGARACPICGFLISPGGVGEADADPDGPTGDPAAADAPPTGADLLHRAGCTACRGHCCRLGQDHAFLRPATLRRFHKAHPEMTGAEVVETYLAYVPEESS